MIDTAYYPTTLTVTRYFRKATGQWFFSDVHYLYIGMVTQEGPIMPAQYTMTRGGENVI